MSEAPPSGPPAFRTVMGRWATGVSVVTARDGSVDAGLTVNGLLSVSLEPASLLVSLQHDVDTLSVLLRSRRFGVSFLSAEQRALSDRFARRVPSEEKFRDLAFHRGAGGVPLLDDALATLECHVVSSTPVYDHVLVVGEVDRTEEGPAGAPLVFFRGAYAEDAGGGRLQLGQRPG